MARAVSPACRCPAPSATRPTRQAPMGPPVRPGGRGGPGRGGGGAGERVCGGGGGGGGRGVCPAGGALHGLGDPVHPALPGEERVDDRLNRHDHSSRESTTAVFMTRPHRGLPTG